MISWMNSTPDLIRCSSKINKKDILWLSKFQVLILKCLCGGCTVIWFGHMCINKMIFTSQDFTIRCLHVCTHIHTYVTTPNNYKAHIKGSGSREPMAPLYFKSSS